jgi:probable HAF family extracellular repeat protein
LGAPSEALAVNDSGHVVGDRGQGDGVSAFFLSGSAAQDMGALPGYTACRAMLVNNADQAVGECNSEQGTQGFVWSSTGGMQGLGLLPGGDFSSASGINKNGVVVGSSGSSLGTHAFVWTQALGMQDLNGLIPNHPEIVLSGAVGINDAGDIIAFGTTGNGANHKIHLDLDHDSHAGPLHMFLLTPIASSAPR